MEYQIFGGYSSGKSFAQLKAALLIQEYASITVFVKDLKSLDFAVKMGIKPSNIVLTSEIEHYKMRCGSAADYFDGKYHRDVELIIIDEAKEVTYANSPETKANTDS